MCSTWSAVDKERKEHDRLIRVDKWVWDEAKTTIERLSSYGKQWRDKAGVKI